MITIDVLAISVVVLIKTGHVRGGSKPGPHGRGYILALPSITSELNCRGWMVADNEHWQ